MKKEKKIGEKIGLKIGQKIGQKVREENQTKSEGHISVLVPFLNCVFAPP